MKVAIDAGPLYGHRTGVGVAAVGMIDALDRHPDVELAPYLVSGRATPQPGHRRLPLPGIAASHLWSRSDRPRADRWLGDVDLVHGTNYVLPPSHRPSIVSVYDCWFLRHADAATPIVRRAGQNLRRAVARGAWVHTTSHATADEARALLGTDRVEVVLLGPPDADPAPAQTPSGLTELDGRRFVVAIGTEERRKDLPLLLAAFEHVAADLDVDLVVAGAPGDDADRVTTAIEALAEPIRARVHRLGPVDAPSKAWLLRHAAVLAYPSLDEGFGFPILEANAAGTPVVAMAVGSIPEVAGEAAVLIDDPDRRPSEFAAALADTLGGSGRLGLIEAGYRNLRRFDWAATADQLVALYQRALETT